MQILIDDDCDKISEIVFDELESLIDDIFTAIETNVDETAEIVNYAHLENIRQILAKAQDKINQLI